MRYRKLGNTGLIVSEMRLGAMTFGSGDRMWATVAGVSQDDTTNLIKAAFDGAAAHGRRPQPDWPLALPHHGEHQRAPEAAAGRSHRPLPAADNIVSVAQVALACLLAQPHVTSVIIGAKNQEQLLDNIAATEITLSPEQLKAISEASVLPSEYPQWMLTRQSADRLGQVSG